MQHSKGSRDNRRRGGWICPGLHAVPSWPPESIPPSPAHYGLSLPFSTARSFPHLKTCQGFPFIPSKPDGVDSFPSSARAWTELGKCHTRYVLDHGVGNKVANHQCRGWCSVRWCCLWVVVVSWVTGELGARNRSSVIGFVFLRASGSFCWVEGFYSPSASLTRRLFRSISLPGCHWDKATAAEFTPHWTRVRESGRIFLMVHIYPATRQCPGVCLLGRCFCSFVPWNAWR